MTKHALTLLALALLTGCATKGGNYAGVTGQVADTIARHAAKDLRFHYPAVDLVLQQSDAFGRTLRRELMVRGYATEPTGRWLPLNYAIKPIGGGLVMVFLKAGADQHSVVYTSQGAPFGPWTYRGGEN